MTAAALPHPARRRGALQLLASTRLSSGLFALLGAVVLATHFSGRVPGWSVAAPLALLALNLVAAMACHARLRRGGLGLFHACLLGCLLLLAWGRLAHFEGRVEVAEGQDFDAAAVVQDSAGPWHDEAALAALRFRQGLFAVDYAPGVKRAGTRAQVLLDGQTQVVGDDRPLVLQGFRFYTTHNKGFAPLLHWQPETGAPQTGHLHLPAWPLFDWRQQQHLALPGGPALDFWLHLDQALPERAAFTLVPQQQGATLVVALAGPGAPRHELRPGQSLALPGGTLRFERLDGWMGWRIQRDPAMHALLLLASLGVLGLAAHLLPTPPAARRAGMAARQEPAA
jgi:cytochrome c biogenesis protein